MKKFLHFGMILGTLILLSCKVSAGVFLSAYDRIMLAVESRDEKALKEMIAKGININAQNPSGQTALCTVLRRQDAKGYEMLFNQGATIHTSCIRQIDSRALAAFYQENPNLGRYENGRILVPIKEHKERSVWLGAIPWPHVGEILLAGVAVGVSIAAGGSGKAGSSGATYDSNLFTPVKEVNVTKDNFPALEHYWDETQTFDSESEFIAHKLTYKNEEWDAVETTPYAWAYNGGGDLAYRFWDETEEKYKYTLVNSMAFLPMIKAGAAYLRGYTGYMIDRSDVDNPKIDKNKKIKIAVMDTGLEIGDYAHPLLANNISKTRLNYSYGPCSGENSKKCWTYYKNVAYLVQDETKPVRTSAPGTYLSRKTLGGIEDWNKYASNYAPVCSETKSNCIEGEATAYAKNANGQYLDKNGDVTENPDDYVPTLYKVTYYPSNWTSESGGEIEYKYVVAAIWNEYTDKYGQDGYVYNVDDPTPALFSEEDHGTFVAGIAAAHAGISGGSQDGEMFGVAPDAEIIPIRLDFDMQEVTNHLSDAVDTGAQVINLSLGSEDIYLARTEDGNNALWNNTAYFPEAVKKGYKAAAEKGTVLVFAAGNENRTQPTIDVVAPLAGTSGSLEKNYANSIYKNLLISVVAVDEQNKISVFESNGTDVVSASNRCGASSMYCLAAPGGSEANPIFSTSLTQEYAISAGTSMSTAVVSGSVALLMGAFPFLKPQEVVQILFETATPLTPTGAEIKKYNEMAWKEEKGTDPTENDVVPDVYSEYSTDKYNAIYGHGLINLDKATSPIEVPKIHFTKTASSTLSVSAALTTMTVPSALAHTLSVLPKNIVVLDKYTRPYAMSTKRFVNVEKRKDNLKRSFQSFMAADEKQVQASDHLSFGFTEAPSDSVGLPTGSLSMQMKPTADMSIRMGYTQDTKSFGGTYADRIIQNPFMNMRQAWGTDVAWRVAGNWSLIGGFKYGQNGFIDSDTLDKMSDRPMMQVVQTGVRYAPKKSIVFDVTFGQMREEESLLGLRGEGAFKTDGNKTNFISFGATVMPFDKWQLSASYTYGMTNANTTETLMKFSRLTSDAFALTALYKPDEQYTYGLKMVSPLRVRSGTVSFDLPTARDMYEDRLYRTQFTSAMKPDAREYDLSFFFINQLKQDLSLAGEAGVRLHPEHQKEAKPDYQTLLKVNWGW